MHDESTPMPIGSSGEVSRPEDGGPSAEKSGGGDVLSLIADVEKHLERIRDVQNRQTSDFADIAERQRRVADAESAASARASELEQASNELEAARREIEERARELEMRQASAEEERREVDRLRGELESVRTEIEAERARVTALVAETDGRRQELDGRAAELEQREQDLVTRLATAEASAAAAQAELQRVTASHEERLSIIEHERREAAERERELQSRCEETEASRHELEQGFARREQDLEETRAAAEQAKESLVAAERELEESRGALESLRSEFGAATEQIGSLEDRLRTETSGFETKIQELQVRCDANEQEIADRRRALEAAEAQAGESEASLNAARARIESLEARISEDERQLTMAGAKLTELAQVISEHAPQLERGAEAMAMVPELEAEIVRLREQVAQAATDQDDARRIEFEQRIAALEGELEEARSRVSEEGIDAEAATAMIAEARAPLERRIAELDGMLEEARAGSIGEAQVEAAVEAATTDLRAELAEVRRTSDEVVSRKKYEAVKDRCQKAERRSDELETALSMTNDRGQAQEMAKRLRFKAERVGDFARHLDLRRKRLAGVRAALAERRASRNQGNGVESHQEFQRLEAQRQELDQVREFLGRSEQQMVRRWARPRSVALVAWFAVIVSLAVAAGWFGARDFMPTPGVATVSLTAAGGAGERLSTEQAAGWNTWHQALATDPAFVGLVQKRLAARGLETPGAESAVARMLTEDLVFETEGPGRLRLLLSGPDARVLEPTLDAVATAMASESARQAPRRLDGTRATLPPEREAANGVAYASLVGGPMSNAFLARVGMIAGGVLVVALTLVWGLYAGLSRSKRIFEAREAGGDEILAT